jgi:hypothetical protein
MKIVISLISIGIKSLIVALFLYIVCGILIFLAMIPFEIICSDTTLVSIHKHIDYLNYRFYYIVSFLFLLFDFYNSHNFKIVVKNNRW